jgi:hypothetical protein
MMKKKMALFAIMGFLLGNSIMAQEIDSSLAASGRVHILRLQKSYTLGEGIMIRSSVGNITVNQSIQTAFVDSSSNSFGTNNTGFNYKRARLTIRGNIFDKRISFSTRVNFSSNYASATTGSRSFNNELEEALIQYSPSPTHAFSIGLRADYIDTRETRIEGEDQDFIGRSAVSSAYDAVFDYGIRYVGKYHIGGKQILKPYLSLTTGESRAGLQKNYGGLKYGIRIDYYPFDDFSHGGDARAIDEEREPKPKLVVGAVCSINKGASSAAGVNGGRYLYGDAGQNVVLPDYTKCILDYLFKYRGFYSLGSLVATSANVPTNIAGYYKVSGSYVPYSGLTTHQIDSTVRSILNLGTGYSFQAGYLFKANWSLSGRYSFLNSDVYSAAFAGFNKNYSVVLTKYLSGNNLKVQAEFDYNQLQTNLQSATTKGTCVGQIMFSVNL